MATGTVQCAYNNIFMTDSFKQFVSDGYLYDYSAYKSQITFEKISQVKYDTLNEVNYWHINASGNTITVNERNRGGAQGLVRCFYSWELGFKIRFNSVPTNGIIFSNNREATTNNGCAIMFVNGQYLEFGTYNNCSTTDWEDATNYQCQFLMKIKVEQLVGVGWVDFRITYNKTKDQIYVVYKYNDETHNVIVTRIASYSSTSYCGTLFFGGSTPMISNTPYLDCDITNFYIQYQIANTELGSMLKSPLSYPNVYVLIGFDLYYLYNQGTYGDCIDGGWTTFPVCDTSNTLFSRPTYSFTGSQYFTLASPNMSFGIPHDLAIDVWFKASQTSTKATIWDNGAVGGGNNTIRTYIYSNKIYCYLNSTEYLIGSFTDTSSWHFLKVLYQKSTGTWKVYFDGTMTNSGSISSSSYITVPIVGRDSTNANYFKGNMSNFRISDDLSTTVPITSFEPKTY